MPEDYIIHRQAHEKDGSTGKWQTAFDGLSAHERKEGLAIIGTNVVNSKDIEDEALKIKKFLKIYI